MSRSWRDRPTGSFFSRLWRPWVALNPRKGRGRSINETRSVGIRDLVASPDEIGSRPERRWMVIGIFFLMLLIVLVYRLFNLQIASHAQSVANVNANSLRTSSIAAPRGLILDRTGHPLVTNKLTTEIQLSRAQASLDPAIKGALAALTGVSVQQINADLNNQQYDPYQPAPIMTNAKPHVVEFIKTHPKEFPGVSVLDVATRSYPLGGLTGSEVLGYVGAITGAEIAAHPNQGYSTNSQIGKTGIESFYEKYLRGRPGTRSLTVDAFGNILGSKVTTKPVSGDSVVLNIDSSLQRALDKYLTNDIMAVRKSIDPVSHVHPKAPNGAALVMDVKTGAVLAMSSYPSYNLNSFVNGLSETTFKHLLNEGAFNNYAIQGMYTPGSTFKMISATAQLQTGIFPADKVVDDTGSFTVPGCLKVGARGCVFHDDQYSGAGLVTLPTAITVSSDYYFYNLGYLFWSQQAKYGKTPIQNVAAKYGLGQYTNIDLPDEVQGRVDSPSVRKQLHAQAPTAFPNVAWYTGDNIEMAFGQGATAVTPIEMAQAYATFANGGTRYAPEVAAAVVSPAGKVIERYRPRVLGHVHLPPSVRDPILQGLTGVIEDPRGTAYYTFHQIINFNLATYPLAGKTGTASNAPGLAPNSWFVGFGPTTNPRYVVVCVLAQGGYGSEAAAPVVAEAFNFLHAHPPAPLTTTAHLGLPRTPTTSTSTTTTTSPGG